MRTSNQFVSACISMAVIITLAGCNINPISKVPASKYTSDSELPKKITLTAVTNLVGEWALVLEDILLAYSSVNPAVDIEFSAPGKDYDNVMKIKMATNEMPDLFSTHGWAKIRYGSFVADLRDRTWASRIDPGFKPIISDESGKIYTFAFDQDKSGPIYNLDIFEKYGIEVPETFDEFIAACETIKNQSGGEVTPIACSAEGWQEAQFFDFFASALFISPESNYSSQLLDGSFDWGKWDILAEKWLDMYHRGYLNKNMLNERYEDNIKALALGKAAIGFYGPYIIDEIKRVNPEVSVDMMPIPSMADGDIPTFAGGERSTLAVWKDSGNLEAALKVVDFCARPDNIVKMCSFTKLPPALTGINGNFGELTGTYEKYKDLRTLPYFDRVYLPNGMWDVMCRNSQQLIAGIINEKQFSKNMEQEYLSLRSYSGPDSR